MNVTRPKRDFICPNETCNKKFWWNASDDELDKKICLKCAATLVYLPSSDEEVEMDSLNYLRFKSLSSDQKHEMLKKRSSVHYKKEIEERKVQMQKDMLNRMTGR